MSGLNQDIYDKFYLKNSLEILEYEVDDLEKWSVKNDDEGNEEIYLLRQALDLVKKYFDKK